MNEENVIRRQTFLSTTSCEVNAANFCEYSRLWSRLGGQRGIVRRLLGLHAAQSTPYPSADEKKSVPESVFSHRLCFLFISALQFCRTTGLTVVYVTTILFLKGLFQGCRSVLLLTLLSPIRPLKKSVS